MSPEDRLRTELQALENSVPVGQFAETIPARPRGRIWPAVAVMAVLVVSTAVGFGVSVLLQRPSSGSGTNGGPVTAEVREGDFVLRITAPRSSWAMDEPIAVSATLTYDGALEEIELGASGSGPLAFSVVELEGTRAMKAGWDSDCAQHRLIRNQPLLKPYAKSGAWSPGDPNEAFYRDFFAEPEFRLPPGRWEVSAETLFSVGACSADTVEMRATIVLDVKPSVVAQVSLSHPTRDAERAIEACGVRERIDAAIWMGQLPASDLRRYLPFTGREPELQTDKLVWAVEFRWDLKDAPVLATRAMAGPIKTDHLACVVIDDVPLNFILGLTADADGNLLSPPVPVSPGPDLHLPLLAE